MPTQATTIFGMTGLQPLYNPQGAKVTHVNLPVGSYVAGLVLAQVAGTGTAVNEVQTLTLTGGPTGGTVTLSFNGQVTAPIAYNASAATIAAALAALPNVGADNVVGGGGPWPAAVTVTFQNLLGGVDQPLIVMAANALTGGATPSMTIAQTTQGKPAGGHYVAYNDAGGGTVAIAKAALQYATTVEPDGRHRWGGGERPGNARSAPAFFSGNFLCADLVGLDANAVVDLGRLTHGTAFNEAGASLYIVGA